MLALAPGFDAVGALACATPPASASAPTSPRSARTRRCSAPARCRRSSTDAGGWPSSWRAVPAPHGRRAHRPVDDLRREFTAQIERITRGRAHGSATSTPTSTSTCGPRSGAWCSTSPRPPASRLCASSARPAAAAVGVTVRRLGRAPRAPGRAPGGFRFPATATGLDEAGTLDAPRLVRRHRPAGRRRRAERRAGHPPGRGRRSRPATATTGATCGPSELAGLADPAVRRRVERRRVPPRHLRRSRGGMREPLTRRRARRPRIERHRTGRPVPRRGAVALVPVRRGRDARAADGAGARSSAAATALFALYLAATAPERPVTGVDVDAAKLAAARRAADARRPRRALRPRCRRRAAGGALGRDHRGRRAVPARARRGARPSSTTRPGPWPPGVPSW